MSTWNATVLPPTNKYAIKKATSARQENLVLPGSKNPACSLFPASLSHDKMIGPSKSPGNAGGLVGRRTLSCRRAIQGGSKKLSNTWVYVMPIVITMN